MIQISPSSSSKHSYRVLVFLYFTPPDKREEKCCGISANFIQSGQRTPVFCFIWWSLLHAERREAFSWNFNPSGCQQFCHLDQILWLICDSLFSPMIIICGFFSEWITLLLLLFFRMKIVKNVSQCFYRAQVDVLKRLFCPRRQTKIFSLLSEEKKPERLLTTNRFMLAALFNAANQNIVVVALITTQLKMSVCIPGWLIVKWSHQTCSCREPLCDHFILYMKVYN